MGLRTRFLDLADHLSFLAQWVLYRAILLLERLRDLFPPFGRDPALWVFGARGGEAFADNAKYLYLHVAAERPEVRPVWLSKDRAVVADLQSAGYEAYHCYSLRGLLLNLRARVVLFTQGHRDLAMPCCAGAFAVQLWHGVPLKRISWDAEFPDLPWPVRLAHADMAEEMDLLAVPDRELVEIFASGLRIAPDRMVLAGYPRNDALFDAIPGEEVATDSPALARVSALAGDGRLVAYLPTYRGWTDESVADRLDFASLDDFLAERDATLVVKTHPNESIELPEDCSRVVQLPAATDPYPLLRQADALVTDYSSVYVDYLLLDRPIVYYPYDLDEYRSMRGFYLDYDSVTPGPVAQTFDDLLDGLDRALARSDADADRRQEVRERLLDGDPGVRDHREESLGGNSETSRERAGAGMPAPARSRPSQSAVPPSRTPRSAAVFEAIRSRLRGREGRPSE
ncbi:CDP-glycerol glycerophosphotransferase family protein [Halorussus litoreus]|uniref:CDP-glycerol glycerophosphotransferase family protein n=1 Tax=Halorussus litoreus TaxID=1710536 RepID=UPI000E230A9E|nr:CDP-glycerol glycerophosphotransferase family protein [Halorussus litoreus]